MSTKKHTKTIKFKKNNKPKKYNEIELAKKPKRGSSKRKITVFRNRIIALCVVLALFLLITYISISFSHPIGVFEFIKNSIYASGSGDGYDIGIEGGKPIYTVTDGKVYFVTTDTTVNCYNTSGKVIFEKFHTFENPVVKKSETRYMLYDQGENA